MKKNTIKAFTLVEMLIVIVIIGILIASLMPRMQSAQGRARDVARKNDLSQIQTAIITSQQDKGTWPELTQAQKGMAIGSDKTDYTYHSASVTLVQDLQNAGMTQVPTDPNGSNQISGLGDTAIEEGKYGYMVTKRNSVEDGGFVLMAKTEVEGSSNWVVCNGGENDDTECTKTGNDKDNLVHCGMFDDDNGIDLKNVVFCSKFTKGTKCEMDGNGECFYVDDASLRYIVTY